MSYKAKVYKDKRWWWWEVTDSTGGITSYGGRDTWEEAFTAALDEIWSLHQWATHAALLEYTDKHNTSLQLFYNAEENTERSREFWNTVGKVGETANGYHDL
jgi:hypothetical protein